LTWETVFAAYPNLHIVHQARRVHSNVDLISRLHQRVSYQQGPAVDATQHISLELTEDPICDMYSELGEKFEEKLISVVSDFGIRNFQGTRLFLYFPGLSGNTSTIRT
jgi:hypothetical protein